ncbi:Exopolysaccharide phosphotransferase OS=Streptomyces microflavus OX=1919 GN=Smic_65880 PE=3 SV=1 [Streptomyces microflavus]
MVRRFLDSYFPVASPFELHGSQGAPTRRTHELGRTAG